jgi:hypothetical protein
MGVGGITRGAATKKGINCLTIASKTMGQGGSRALAVGLPASVNAGRVGVLRLKVQQERVPSMEEPPRDHMQCHMHSSREKCHFTVCRA